MANYFVINNKFRPYSFDELIKPLQIYGQAYKEQEAMLDAAREKEFSPDYLDQTQDKAAYDMYSTANQQLQAASDELATQGLSSSLRGRIRTTARDYKRTMDTLNEAQARLYAERDRRAKLGDDYVYQQNDLRIGDFLNGASPNQRNQSLSGITKDIAAEFSSRAKGITRDTWNKVFANNGKVIGGYFDVATETDLTSAQLDSILADNATWGRIISNPTISKEQKELLQSFRDVISAKKQSIDFDSYGDYEKGLIDDAIVKGAHGGLGTTSHDYKQDRNFESPELRYRKERDKVEDKRLEEQRDIESGKTPFYIDPTTGKRWYTNSKNKTIWSTDKDGKIIDEPTTATNLGRQDEKAIKAYTETAKNFPIYFTDTTWGWRGKSANDKMSMAPGGRSNFNEVYAKEMPVEEIGVIRRRQLNEELAKYGLTENDVVIYHDRDPLYRDEWKVVLKQQNPDGTETAVPVATVTQRGVEMSGQALSGTTPTTPRNQRLASDIPGVD